MIVQELDSADVFNVGTGDFNDGLRILVDARILETNQYFEK